MLRRIVARALAPAFALAGLASAGLADDPRFAADFAQALRERGYYDLAIEYLDGLRRSPDTPDDLRKTLDYEEGRTLIEAAAHASDPDASKESLDRAKVKIEAFVKAYPDLPQTTEALVDLAHLLYERGMTEVDLAGDARVASEKDNKLAGARGYYENARTAYGRAFERLRAKLDSYPKTPLEEPEKSRRERVRNSLMQAELQKAVVDYYEAQTYPGGAAERADLLGKALAQFEDLHKRYRVQMAGFTARMWQGKCYEEQGKLGEAMGIYNELIDHPDPNLRPLQKQVDYFRIIVMARRKEYALAADECVRWLNLFPKDRRSYNALGVQFELAKNILAQLPAGGEGPERDRAVRAATDHLADVVRVVSPFKPEALALLKKYRPAAVLAATDAARLNYDEALGQAEQAISTLDFERGIALLKVAIRKADPVRDPAKVNKARFTLAYCLFMTKRHFEAAVVAEHLARRYPSDEWSAKAADLATSAMIEGYTTLTAGDRAADLDRVVSLAKYAAATWPDTEQGDSGRMTVGQVALKTGRYPEAIAAFDAVRPSSTRSVDARATSGIAHWQRSLILREKGDAPAADAEVRQAVGQLEAALNARREARAPESDPGLVNNACDLADIRVETGQADRALALLDPIARKLAESPRSAAVDAARTRVVAATLRGHVAAGQTDLAIADMKALEAIGGSANGSAKLYLDLGKLLEREIEALEKRKDQAGLDRTRRAYQKFLNDLVATKSAQSFAVLQWAGEGLLKLGQAKEAADVFARTLDYYSKDAAFQKGPNAAAQLLRVRIKQVAALRVMGSLSEAQEKLDAIIEENKRSLEPQMEKGFLLDARAEANEIRWAEPYAYWREMALKIARMNPRPVDYYEAWYRAAVALQKQGKPDLAKQTVASVMRLSPTLGSPEMKAKYQELVGKGAK